LGTLCGGDRSTGDRKPGGFDEAPVLCRGRQGGAHDCSNKKTPHVTSLRTYRGDSAESAVTVLHAFYSAPGDIAHPGGGLYPMK